MPALSGSEVVTAVGVGLTLALALLVVRHADRPEGRWLAHLRSRFLLGVPWGTLLVCGLLLSVYLLVQRPAADWSRPLVIPFRSWSYAHPVGVVLAPFAHADPGHLVENLTGTLVFGTLAEFAVGHCPPDTADDGPLADPRVRAFVAFPAGAIIAGVLTSAFAWGPTLGFSGVVFAFAGVALVRYPLGTVLALVSRQAVETGLRAVTDPVVVASGTRASGQPWWVDVAVQVHGFGLLLGIVVGVVLFRRRTALPSTVRTWSGVVLLAVTLSLWALWWVRGNGFVLYRGVGLVVLLVLATVVALAIRAVTRGLPGLDSRRARRVGWGALLVPLLVMAMVAVPINADAGVSAPGGLDALSVDGYVVTYAEDVPDQRFAALGPWGGAAPTTSGVVVADPDRGLWTRALPADRLARAGSGSVRIGGVGWARTVFAVREEWRVVGGGAAYRVSLNPDDGPYRQVFASDPVRAEPTVAGRNLSVVPVAGGFRLRVTGGGEGTAPVPGRGENVTVGGLRVRNAAGRLVVTANETRVTVARRG